MDFSLPSAFHLLITFLLPFLSIAQTYSKIILESSLTALDNNSLWPSLSGDFAFGFQQIGSGGSLLAIWFNKVPEKTIIWSENGNSVVKSGSKVQLTTDGLFVLTGSTGKQVWTADVAGNGVAYAAMLDTGNFVLASKDPTILWESFDHPTDIILPTQVLNQGSKLVARSSDTNYSSGRCWEK